MLKLQVLGAGCSRCHALADVAKEAARERGIEIELEHVTAIEKILEFGVALTPALAVDGVVKLAGRVPSLDEMKRLL